MEVGEDGDYTAIATLSPPDDELRAISVFH